MNKNNAAMALAVAFFSIATAAAAAPADDVKALLEQGKAAEAYALGKQHPELLGEPAFDFFFGIAAIDAGHAGEGALALERYLLNFPDNQSARLQVARGYFMMGDDARAREEFESLQKTKPQADVAGAIQKYLDAIRLRESRYKVSSGGYIEGGVGTDSNVNAGPSASTINVPIVGPTPLARNSRKLSDSFSLVGAGGYVSMPVYPGIALFLTGQGEQRFNQKQETKQFDLGSVNTAAGASFIQGNNLYRLALTYTNLRVGSATFRESSGITGEWQHQIDAAQSVSLGLQSARFKYGTTTTDDGAGNITVTDNGNRNSDFYGITAGYRRVLPMRWEPIVSLGVNAGTQDSRTQRDDLVPRTAGANVGLSLTPAEKWGVQLGYTYLQSDYRAADFFAAPDSRHDRYDAANLTVTYLLSRNWSVRGEALWSENRSNADAYAFTRDVYSVKLRYEFK